MNSHSGASRLCFPLIFGQRATVPARWPCEYVSYYAAAGHVLLPNTAGFRERNASYWDAKGPLFPLFRVSEIAQSALYMRIALDNRHLRLHTQNSRFSHDKIFAGKNASFGRLENANIGYKRRHLRV